ncbi:flagellar hook-basal body protein [Paenibacillus sp. 481]|uniref:flagellar hook-basal body protein n=1 Tax=Paenibacillus sp. 481 TaxID=2835869 RepID=UPI001E5FB254|nr:flagellar hook-basal body protein [Paenibacillus sp. 481]UHA75683.1 flagellar hook-basal body protein [Paenibacillus sp. 481]
MLRGLYTAASGMTTHQRRHDTITNNISNMNTPGYKSVTGVARSFPEMLINLMGDDKGAGKQIGRLNTGVFAEESRVSFLQGDLMQTNQAGDFALLSDIQVPGMAFDASGKAVDDQGNVTYQPQAMFAVQDGEQIRYTRDGSFRLNEQHQLTTADGALVLNRNNTPIVLTGVAMSQLALDEQARLVNAETGALVPNGALLVTRFDNPHELIREGNGRYRLEDGAQQGTPFNFTGVDGLQVQVRQGYLERSTVDPTQSMADMMSAFRAYEANQKMVQFFDKTLEKTVNEIGRV